MNIGEFRRIIEIEPIPEDVPITHEPVPDLEPSEPEQVPVP